MVSDTPRTDVFISELRVRHFNECEAPGIAAMHAWKFNEVQEFARQLERELAVMMASEELVTKQLGLRVQELNATIDILEQTRRELAEAQRDAERYRFLRGKSMLGGNQFYSRIMEIHDEEIDKARGA